MDEPDELLRKSWEAVKAANLPEHVQGVALRLAAEHLVGALSVSARPTAPARSAGPAGPGQLPAGGMIARLAQKLRLDQETVSHVFNQDGDALEIVVAHGKLEKKNSAATKQIAILVVAGRQGAGLEEWTPASEVRKWCEQFKKLDSNNFASTLRQLESHFTFRGSSQARQLHTTAPGWDRATELVRQLGGAE